MGQIHNMCGRPADKPPKKVLPTPVNGHYDNSNQQLNTTHCGKDAQWGKDMQWGVGLGWVRCQQFWPAFGAALLAVDQCLWHQCSQSGGGQRERRIIMVPCCAKTEGDQGNVLEHNEDELMNQDEDEQNQDEPTEHAQHTPLHFTQSLVAASSRHNPSCHSCCLVRTHMHLVQYLYLFIYFYIILATAGCSLYWSYCALAPGGPSPRNLCAMADSCNYDGSLTGDPPQPRCLPHTVCCPASSHQAVLLSDNHLIQL